MQTKASEQDARLRMEQKASQEMRALLARFNDEQLPDDKRIHRKIRVHTDNRQLPPSLLTRLFNNPIIQGLMWSKALDGATDILKAASLLAQWPSVTQHQEQARYMKVDDTLHPDLEIAFAEVSVSPDVARRIEQEIREVRDQDMIVAQHYTQGYMGPFGAHKRHYALMQEFQLRHNAITNDYAHCITRVADMEQELGCDDSSGPCMVRVFGVVSLGELSGRKPGVSVAEAGAEMTVSDQQALEKAAPVIIVPPHLNFVP